MKSFVGMGQGDAVTKFSDEFSPQGNAVAQLGKVLTKDASLSSWGGVREPLGSGRSIFRGNYVVYPHPGIVGDSTSFSALISTLKRSPGANPVRQCHSIGVHKPPGRNTRLQRLGGNGSDSRLDQKSHCGLVCHTHSWY